jgi:hypothetical protein
MILGNSSGQGFLRRAGEEWMAGFVFPRRTPSLFFGQIAVAMLGIYFSPLAVQSAPITLLFEATVARAFPMDDGVLFPFTISPGDSLRATLTFEPGSPGPIYPQSGDIQITVSGTSIHATNFQIRVAHDENIGIDIPGRIADPNNTPDADGSPTGDSMYISCLNSGPLFCGVVPGQDELVFQPTVVFAEPALILSSNDLPADSEIWNKFSRREMSLLFRDQSTAEEVYYVGAYISNVREVPEPRAFLLACTLACVITIWALASRFLPYRVRLQQSSTN